MILKKIPININFFHAVVVICFNPEGKIILLKKHNTHPYYSGLWGNIAGKVEKGECAIEAGLREVREETGICVPWQSIVNLNVKPTVHYDRQNKNPLYFHCHTYYLLPEYYYKFRRIKLHKKEHCASMVVPPQMILKMNRNIFIPDAYENIQNYLQTKVIE